MNNNIFKIILLSGLCYGIYFLFFKKDCPKDIGLADKLGKTEEDFPEEKVKLGTEIEMEHTQYPERAKKIALDHLAEDEDYYDKLAQITKNNPERKIQSIIFDKDLWTLSEAKNWLKRHGYKYDVDEKPNTYRFQQETPRHFKQPYYTKEITDGIKIVVGTLKKEYQ